MQRQWTRQRIAWFACIVLWMGVIFFFSSQNGEESSNLSGGITTFLAHLIQPDLDQWAEAEQQEFLGQLSFWVRKGARFFGICSAWISLDGICQNLYVEEMGEVRDLLGNWYSICSV